MHLTLPTHAEFTFAPLDPKEACDCLKNEFSRPSFYTPALSMVEAPTPQTFVEACQEGVIAVWTMRRLSGATVGFAILNTWTSVPSVFVYVPTSRTYDVALTQAALDALIPIILAADSGYDDVLCPVPHPEPADAELMLATLGFETIGCRKEFEDVMTSYWLQRKIWEAYFGNPPAAQDAKT